MISSAQFQKKQLIASIPVVTRKEPDKSEVLVVDRWGDGPDAHDAPLIILDPKKFDRVKSGDFVMTDKDKGAELQQISTIGGRGHGSHTIKTPLSFDNYIMQAGFRDGEKGALASDGDGLWLVAYK